MLAYKKIIQPFLWGKKCLEKHLWNKLHIKYAGATFKIPFHNGCSTIKRMQSAAPQAQIQALSLSDSQGRDQQFPNLLEKLAKTFSSISEFYDFGLSLFEINKSNKEKYSLYLEFMEPLVQDKMFINAVFVLKQWPLETNGGGMRMFYSTRNQEHHQRYIAKDRFKRFPWLYSTDIFLAASTQLI